MTIEELFKQAPFVEMVPYLIPMIKERNRDLHRFREAYDFLRACDVVKGPTDSVALIGRKDQDHLYVHGLDSSSWPEALGTEVVCEGEISIPLPLMAACCLLEITVFGFNEEDRHGKGDELDRFYNPTGEYHRMYISMLRKYAKFDYVGYPMNGPKRMRLNRLSCRIGSLHELAERETLIMRMHKAFSKDEVSTLIDMEYVQQYEYRSALSTGNGRLDYILQSIRDYQEIDSTLYDGAFFWVTVPNNHPWSDEKWENFQQEVQSHLQLCVKFGIYRLSCQREEIAGSLILYKSASVCMYSQCHRGKYQRKYQMKPTYFMSDFFTRKFP